MCTNFFLFDLSIQLMQQVDQKHIPCNNSAPSKFKQLWENYSLPKIKCCLQDLKLKICLICSCLGISLQHRHGWTSLLSVFLSFQFIDTAVTNCSKFSIIVVELLANLLHRTSCFANFKGIWLFLFAQSFQWGRG